MLGLILQSIRNVQPWNVYSEEVIVVIYREINDLNTVLALVVVAITFQLFQSYAKQPKCISIYVQVSKMGMEVFPRTGLSSLFPQVTLVSFTNGSAVVFAAQHGHRNHAVSGVEWRQLIEPFRLENTLRIIIVWECPPMSCCSSEGKKEISSPLTFLSALQFIWLVL